MTNETYREFAKRYIDRRLTENRADAIEELASYLGDWLWMRRNFTKLVEHLDEDDTNT